MALPISVQLYSVRDYIARDGFAPVLKRIADIGYKGVEPAGFFNLRPSELKKMTADLGLEIYSSHSPWAHNAGGLPEQLDIASILGLDTIVCGYGPDNFKDLDSIKKTADNTNAMVDFCSKNGLKSTSTAIGSPGMVQRPTLTFRFCSLASHCQLARRAFSSRK